MQGDTLALWIYNTDSVMHDFVIKGTSSVISIPANDSAFLQTVFTSIGSYIYHDPSDFPKSLIRMLKLIKNGVWSKIESHFTHKINERE